MSDAHAEDIDKHVRGYMLVFGALMVLTAITVGISYIEFSTPVAIALALIVATTKGSLVALYFMHLISEKAFIYVILAFTIAFFFVMIFLPVFTTLDEITL